MTSSEATAPAPPPARSGAGVATTIAAFIGLALGPSAIAVLSFGVFAVPMMQEFGWPRVQIFLAPTIVAYMIMAVSPVQGFLTDRFGPRKIILASIPLFAAGLAAFYFLPAQQAAYYLLWGAIPVLSLGLWPLGYLKAVSGWFEKRLGLALGIANAGIGVGAALVPVLANQMIAAYGWRAAFLGVAAVVLVVSLPAVFFLLKDPFVRGSAAPTPQTWGVDYRPALKQGHFWRLAVAFVLLGSSTTALITQQVPMLIDAGWSPARAAAVQSVFGVGLMAGRLGIGYFIDRIFAPYVMAVVAFAGALGCALYGWTPTSNLAFVASLVIGLVVGAEFDVLAFLIKRYFGPRAFGKIYGAIFAVFQLASGLGVVFLSSVRDRTGDYSPGFYAFGVVLTLAAIVFLTSKPYVFGPGGEIGEAD